MMFTECVALVRNNLKETNNRLEGLENSFTRKDVKNL